MRTISKSKYRNIRNGTDRSDSLSKNERNTKYNDVKSGLRHSAGSGGVYSKYRDKTLKNGTQGSRMQAEEDLRLQRFKYDHLHLKNGADVREKPRTEQSEERMRRRLRTRRIRRGTAAVVVAAAIVVFCRVQFGPAIIFADISEYAQEEILITGLLDEDFTVTPEELTELDLVRETATGNSAKAGTVQAIGPTLETFAESYGRSLDDFEKVKFIAEDDYTTSLVETLDEEIILSVANGRESLEDYQQPLRVVIPGVDSGTWVRMVIEIQFTEK